MTSQHDFGVSQVPANPCFRNAAVNTVAVVPLLSSDDTKDETSAPPTHSVKSFEDLVEALRRHCDRSDSSGSLSTKSSAVDGSAARGKSGAELLLVVPNSSLTRPGDWRYQDTPLKAFHWQHGCQRLQIHDGRPTYSRHAYDRLLAASVTRDWIDLCPSRRTAAVIGVLNMHDCRTATDLERACEELQQWAHRYSTPPYAATAHGRGDCDRDTPVTRLFVYDSFDEESQKFDLAAQSVIPGTSILAFPPTDEAHQQMMDLHLNLVVSDLTVAIFRDLEQKVQESLCLVDSEYSLQQQADAQQQQGGLARRSLARFVTGSSGDSSAGQTSEEPAKSTRTLGIGQLAGLVNPESKLAKESPTNSTTRNNPTPFAEGSTGAPIVVAKLLSKLPPLLTPLDDEVGASMDKVMGAKDAEAMRKRDIGRREKFLADLCLLAGSPLDAYEHYLKAAELCKNVAMDPLWHASALEGCAAAHIAMAEAGGYSVDEYLENNFQLPEEIMAMAREDPAKKQTAGGSVAGKQTLPEVVFVLCDEALNILNRHGKLGHLYAELLLKLASYCADEAEAHLRCRWGEGPNCYPGEQGDEARWEKTSVNKLKFNPLRNKEGDSMIAINTHSRIKKLCALLGVAASVGSLDAATRVDVAIRCARICVDGVVPTYWKGPVLQRIKLPRKAAFFVVVAAEAASGKDESAVGLWKLASRLYTLTPNPVDGGGDYGWATLRAICFDSLAVQGSSGLNLEAAEQLLSLLGELDPDMRPSHDMKRKSLGERNVPRAESDVSVPEPIVGAPAPKDLSISRASMSLDDVDMQEAFASASQFAKNIRVSYTSFTAGSPLLAQQSKWAVDDPIPSVHVPLSNSSPLSPSLVTLKSVWPAMEYEIAKDAQRQCLERLWKLRRAVPTHCAPNGSEIADSGSFAFYISSSMMVHSEPHLDLECIQQQASTQSKQGAMATFFNPFAKKKVSDEPTARVADGEERAMIIQFCNRLSLAVEIQQSHLVFVDDGNGRAKATKVTFSLPAKVSAFQVHFPFVVLPEDQSRSDSTQPNSCTTFNVAGVSMTFLGRSLFLPIKAVVKPRIDVARLLAASASVYVHRTMKSAGEENVVSKSRVEAYPSQPKLEVHFAETGASASAIAVSLSDGEVYTVPTLRISSYRGLKHGKIDCLEIYCQGRKLFDSTTASEVDLPESEFVQEMMYGVDPPLVKVRALTQQLCVEGMNDQGIPTGDSGMVTLQIVAAHNFGEKLSKGRSLEVVFRYRGASTSKSEVWRKHCMQLNIVYRQGPYVSSLAFRPDLADGGVFVDSFNKQWSTSSVVNETQESKTEDNVDSDVVTSRVGLDPCVSVCGADAILVLDVTNVTSSSLTLRRLEAPAGGFAAFTLDNVPVHPGVSVKIPIVLPRISRVDETGASIDVLAELVRKTTFVWEGDASKSHRGYIRIPPACLSDVVRQHPAFVSQICQPPCTIQLMVEENLALSSPKSILSVAMAHAVRLEMDVAFEQWVPPNIRDVCILSLEFQCVRKTFSTSNPALATVLTSSLTQAPIQPTPQRREFTWVGKMSHTWDPSNPTSVGKHVAKIIFLQPGTFVVSACARITRRGSVEDSTEKSERAQEIWWAPTAQTIVVNECNQYPTQ